MPHGNSVHQLPEDDETPLVDRDFFHRRTWLAAPWRPEPGPSDWFPSWGFWNGRQDD